MPGPKKRKIIIQASIFRCYVSFREGLFFGPFVPCLPLACLQPYALCKRPRKVSSFHIDSIILSEIRGQEVSLQFSGLRARRLKADSMRDPHFNALKLQSLGLPNHVQSFLLFVAMVQMHSRKEK